MAITNKFLIFKGSEIFRLHKGISLNEVRNLLGNNYTVEACSDKNDEKWVYDFPESKGIYKLLFRQDKLEWAMNGTSFIKDNARRKLNLLQKNKREKINNQRSCW